jgi:hypothetical protein
MALTEAEAKQLAFDFLMGEWDLDEEDRDWFSVLSCRPVGETWYITEIGLEGLPDTWFIQVYDTGECDPNYTFNSPMSPTSEDTDLADLPEVIADLLRSERRAVSHAHQT